MATTTVTEPSLQIVLAFAGLLLGSPAVAWPAEPGVTIQIYRGTDHLRGLETVPTVAEVRLAAPDTAQLRIVTFTGRTPAEVERALAGLGSVTRVVVDLRGNGGGRLEAAREVAELFVPLGALLYIECAGGRRHEVRSRGPAPHAGLALEVLIDRQTASAAEVLAGTLAQARGAQLTGERTAGKGTIFTAEPQDNGRIRWNVTGEVLLPDGTPITRRGLDPAAPPAAR